MVTQNMLRTYEGKEVFSEEKKISDCSRSKQMPLTGQISDIAPHVRTKFWVTISYKSHEVVAYGKIVLIGKIKQPLGRN